MRFWRSAQRVEGGWEARREPFVDRACEGGRVGVPFVPAGRELVGPRSHGRSEVTRRPGVLPQRFLRLSPHRQEHLFVGAPQVTAGSSVRAIVSVAGWADRINASAFRAEVARDDG